MRARRLKLGLSKEAMARAAGVSVITYKKVEDDKPVRDTSLALIAAALEREEAKADATLAVSGRLTADATVQSMTRPPWMSADQYDAIMRQVHDFYRYLLVEAKADASPDPDKDVG